LITQIRFGDLTKNLIFSKFRHYMKVFLYYNKGIFKLDINEAFLLCVSLILLKQQQISSSIAGPMDLTHSLSLNSTAAVGINT